MSEYNVFEAHGSTEIEVEEQEAHKPGEVYHYVISAPKPGHSVMSLQEALNLILCFRMNGVIKQKAGEDFGLGMEILAVTNNRDETTCPECIECLHA